MAQTGTTRQRTLDLEKHAEQIFGNPEKARLWLQNPNRALEGNAPTGLLTSETGFARVKNLLDRIDYGVLS